MQSACSGKPHPLLCCMPKQAKRTRTLSSYSSESTPAGQWAQAARTPGRIAAMKMEKQTAPYRTRPHHWMPNCHGPAGGVAGPVSRATANVSS